MAKITLEFDDEKILSNKKIIISISDLISEKSTNFVDITNEATLHITKKGEEGAKAPLTSISNEPVKKKPSKKNNYIGDGNLMDITF